MTLSEPMLRRLSMLANRDAKAIRGRGCWSTLDALRKRRLAAIPQGMDYGDIAITEAGQMILRALKRNPIPSTARKGEAVEA